MALGFASSISVTTGSGYTMTLIRVVLILLFSFLNSLAALLFIAIDRSYRLYFWLTRFYSLGILKICGCKLIITGSEHVKPVTPVVYVSNHTGMFDIPAMQYGVPDDMAMIFKKELARIPFFGWQLALGPYIVIDRKNPEKAMKSIDEAKRLLKERRISILLFAEGTRSKDGSVQPFKRGAFHLASKVQHPIIPVSIHGADAILQSKPFRILPGTIRVHFGEPVTFGELKNKADEVALMEQVRQIVIQNKQKLSEEEARAGIR